MHNDEIPFDRAAAVAREQAAKRQAMIDTTVAKAAHVRALLAEARQLTEEMNTHALYWHEPIVSKTDESYARLYFAVVVAHSLARLLDVQALADAAPETRS